ncbi:MAG: NAD(P)H-binding protein [Microlunatus sp.]|nr:NAD(P)H-binding protein [Microlunatus sp.]
MTDSAGETDVVTGAFSYSGAAIARELTTAGRRVRTLTGHPERAPAGTDIDVRRLQFHDREELTQALRGAHTLYNTYWVRYAQGRIDHDIAVANSRVLFDAAAAAGIGRIVHVSIMRPTPDSPYPYFRGKAEVEQIIAAAGIPYAIVRPALLFGRGGVLVNNVAWLLRHLPVFAVGDRGDYRLRGIHVDDLARLCVRLGSTEDVTLIDAVGPESLTFREFVEAIRSAVGSRAVVVSVPSAVLTGLSSLLGLVLRDRLLTADEYHAMADGLAASDAPTTGTVRFTDWLDEHGADLGRRYVNDLRRHFGRSDSGAARGGRRRPS